MDTTLAARGVIPPQGPPHERFAKQARNASEARSAAREHFTATLPGDAFPSGKAPVDIAPAVADLQRVTIAFNRRLKFEVDHQSHEVTVKVIDGETDKVIKVLPPEELQRLHDSIKETIGFLFDERV
ncbi:MAG: flagellar protein FlaG [Treponema sp.]|nr:flagellar protein FlaG [Treponema sp.]